MWTLTNEKSWSTLADRFDWVRRMSEVPQDPRHHAEGDVAVHTRMVLEALEADPAFRALDAQAREVLWASALLHDVEKFSTTVTESDGSITAHGHARRGAQTTRRILYRDVPAPFALREEVAGLVRYHGSPLWLLEKPDPLKSAIMASYEVNTEWLAILARADALGRICMDRNDLLYRIGCFEEFCREHECFGKPRAFVSDHARMNYLEHEQGALDYVPYDSPGFEVVLMSGLPGAGKDTYVRKHYKQLPIISLDEIRRERKIDPTDRTGTGQVVQEGKERARVLLRASRSFVWNGTNVTRQLRQQLIGLFRSYGAAVRIVYVEAPYASLLAQNRNREEVVPETVLKRLVEKLEVPVPAEAHRVSYVT